MRTLGVLNTVNAPRTSIPVSSLPLVMRSACSDRFVTVTDLHSLTRSAHSPLSMRSREPAPAP